MVFPLPARRGEGQGEGHGQRREEHAKDRQRGRSVIKRSMVRRRHAQLDLSQVVLFGLVLPEPERLMEPWLREIDKALEDEEILESVMTVLRRRWRHSVGRGRAGTPA